MASALVAKRLKLANSMLLVCDIQEKFRDAIAGFPAIVQVTRRLLKGCSALDVPILATEQYPKGLGPTVPELELQTYGVNVFSKTCFSMAGCQSLRDHMNKNYASRKSVILCGIEAHVCIFQTALDLLEDDFNVHLVVDACSSRSQVDRQFAFRALEKYGVQLTTNECVLLHLLRDASHPKFREVQALIKEPTPDSGLLKLS